eukprot:1406776-Pleurochrysis_carterae.AAC.1
MGASTQPDTTMASRYSFMAKCGMCEPTQATRVAILFSKSVDHAGVVNSGVNGGDGGGEGGGGDADGDGGVSGPSAKTDAHDEGAHHAAAQLLSARCHLVLRAAARLVRRSLEQLWCSVIICSGQ